MIEFISQPWHWSVSGVGIVLIMVWLLFLGGQFGVSSNLRTLCAIGGAGNKIPFFDFDWKGQTWNLVFIGGAIIGGYLGVSVFGSDQPVQISQATIDFLSSQGIEYPNSISEGKGYVPEEIFAMSNIGKWQNLIILIIGGFLIGFGTRYAGGCTSGHAISGLSNLQLPSLIAVCGFFAGGLLMTWFILPYLLN